MWLWNNRGANAYRARLNIRLIGISKTMMPAIGIAIPNLVDFWQSYGLSMFDVMLLETVFAVVVVLSEVPCGYFADHYGRRSSLLIGGSAILLGSLWYTKADSFTQFLLAEIAIALGISLTSGADEALLYDTLCEVRKEQRFGHVWGTLSSIEIGASAFYLGIGGFITSQWSIRHNFAVSAALYVIHLVAVFHLRETQVGTVERKRPHLGDMMQVARTMLFAQHPARRIVLISAILFGVMQTIFWVLQPLFKSIGVAPAWNGVVLAILSLAAIFGCRKMGALEKRYGFSGLGLRLVVASLAVCVVIGCVNSLWILPLLAVQQFVRAFLRINVSRQLNAVIESEQRATSLSVKNCCDKLTYAALLTPCGAMVDCYGVGAAFLLCGAILGIALLGFAKVHISAMQRKSKLLIPS